MRRKLLRIGLISYLIAVLLTACTALGPPHQSDYPRAVQPAAQVKPILVAAAASLQKVLQEVTTLYVQANPNQAINYNFAASGALQQQIEQGAPVDVFISAAVKPMKALETKGLLEPGTQTQLLSNQLTLIVPKPTSVPLTDFQQLTQPEVKRISIGEPRSVPAGQYTMEVLENLGILKQVQPKLVLGSNVKSVLTAVETGDVDAGVVYITDAKSSDKVKIAVIANERLHTPIVYPITVLKTSELLNESRKYIKFLQSDRAKIIFEEYGFGIIKP